MFYIFIFLSSSFFLPKIIEPEPIIEFLQFNWGKLHIFPYIDDLPELFIDLFKMILRVGYNIPRLEFIMSKGIC